jgi:hypothetical protein
MAEPHVIVALKDKRAELSGGIADLEKRIGRDSTWTDDIPAVEPAHRENETNLTAEVGQIDRMAPVTAVHGLADGVAVRAGGAGLRALGGNLDDHRIRMHYLLNAAAQNRKKLIHSTSCNIEPAKCE